MRVKIGAGVLTSVPLFLAGIAACAQAPSPLPSLNRAAPPHRVAASYGKLPLSFEPNRGQTDARVQFVSRGAGYTIFLGPTSATFALRRNATAGPSTPPGRQTSMEESAVVRMDLIGANPDIAMQPQDKLPGVANYLMGSAGAKWPTNLPTYAKARSQNVYPGIDLVYYGVQGQLEYDFVLAPGADPSKIRLTFAGAQPVVDASGDLVLPLGAKDSQNDIRFHKPVLYQQVQNVRRPVDGRFLIAGNEVRFQVGSYDHGRELVIDPALAYSSYLGGSSQQSVINAMAINAAGQVYVTGVTNALDYPTTPGVNQPTCPAPMTGGTKCGPSSASAAFVSKISADGQSLIYSTYLGGGGSGYDVGGSAISQGGSGSDFGAAIAVDAKDNAWVLGGTNSNNFPVTADAYSLYCEPETVSFDFGSLQNVGEISGCARFNSGGEYNYSGTNSLFLVKLNPTGTSILYGTFLGGTQGEIPGQIALDATGNIYVSGSAYTNQVGTPAATGQYNYPTTASAFQANAQTNAWSAFVTELAPDGHSLVYSSFLSATSGQTFGGPLAIGAGKIFIGGRTQSPTLPTTAGALSKTCPGGAQCQNNGFVAEFDPTKSGAASLVFSTYLNGAHVSPSGIGFSNSTVSALAADAAGNVYAGGSNQYRDFPTTPGVLQPTCNSSSNDSCDTGFVTKLGPSGALVWSTFYGSPSTDGGNQTVSTIAVDGNSNVYIAANATGLGDYPLSNGFQAFAGGAAYVTELSGDGTHVIFGSFYGGGANIFPTGLAVDAAGDIYLAGYTTGGLPLVNAYHSANAGGFNEGFFAKITAPKAVGTATFVNATASQLGAVAAGSIITAYGVDLATGTASAAPTALTLDGTSARIVDSTGVSTPAPLYFVSPGQVNLLVPSGTALGSATITITSGDGSASAGTVTVAAAAPGLFPLNLAGLVAANVTTLTTGGAQVSGNDFQVVNGAVVALPVNLGPPAQQVFLVLYGTGIAGRSSLANVSVSIGGLSLPAAYAGPQGEAGLDQVNVQIPLSLAGAGDTAISVTVDGKVSNVARITIL